MSELTTYTPAAASAVDAYRGQAVARLGEWAHSAEAAFGVAERLVQTSFVPAAFRGKPMEATAAILAGSEVGLSPMSALKAFDVIQGQAAARAITLRAIVQSYGHEVVLVETTATRCRMKGRRRGTQDWQQVTWTIDRARDLQLLGKDNWKKQPAAMLVARATSEVCRLIAADAILGIGYSAEEVADGALVADVEISAPDAAPETGARRMSRPRAAARPTPEVADEPPVDLTDAPEAPGPDPITLPQQKALHAALGNIGYAEREDKLAFLAERLGREITSSSDLTKGEASAILDEIGGRS